MKLYTKEDFAGCETLEDVLDNLPPNPKATRKEYFYKHIPKNGRYREIGSHQGFGMLGALVNGATYLDGYDNRDRFECLGSYIKEYADRKDIEFNNTITNGSHDIGDKPEVDVLFIDALKRGQFVYDSLMFHKDNVKICMAVDDLVSSPDICKGVDKFLAENEDWIVDYEDRVNDPGIAVLVRKQYGNL